MKLAGDRHRSRFRGQNSRTTKTSLHQLPPATPRRAEGRRDTETSSGGTASGQKSQTQSASRVSAPISLAASWSGRPACLPPLPASCPPRPGLAADCAAQVSPAAVRGGPSERAARDPPRSTGHAPAAPPAAPPAERQSLRSLPGLLYLSGK